MELDDFCFVEHLAVSSGIRGGGLGGRFLDDFLQEHPRVILEVEPPESDIARRRIGFYERHGFFLNRYPYEQPPLRKECGYFPLLLMSSAAPLSEEAFLKVKEEDVYKRQVFEKEYDNSKLTENTMYGRRPKWIMCRLP